MYVCMYIGMRVSIHAPARGATHELTTGFWELVRFNPRSREGSDAHCFCMSLLPCGFNPRSREGSDGRILV